MKKLFFTGGCLLLMVGSNAQDISKKITEAFQQFENDQQLKHAVSSLYVIDAKTGKIVFDKNSQVGLAPASTQKIITSATAFELLGKDFRYETWFTSWLSHQVGVYGIGDPTFGSWRFKSTRDTILFKEIIAGLKKAGIQSISEIFTWDNEASKKIPSGWIYEDIGNYYGAAPYNISWHENQYDIVFIPGKKVGDEAKIDTSATDFWGQITNECKTGPPGSGDNAYIYFIPGERRVLVQGTVPAGVARFTISGAHREPACWFSLSFSSYAKSIGFVTNDSAEYECLVRYVSRSDKSKANSSSKFELDSSGIKRTLYIHYSPSLDSIIYWFLRKSINLYGEALVNTFAYKKQGYNNTEDGLVIVKDFWKQKGIDGSELNIRDGSGLSPLNRVTTHAQVEILKYAKTKDWFPYFFDALPEYNGMKMKSGTISDAKAFCGYQKSKDGKEYIFSFIINNYNGPSSGVVNKMYKVLDLLK